MSVTPPLPAGWSWVEKPPSLFRRFTFEAYKQTRAFLDELASLSEQTGLYPDLGFGPKHVNVTIYGPNGGTPGADEMTYAARAAALAEPVVP